MSSPSSYPVRIEGDLDPSVSRGLWLVKWLLVFPHLVVLALLWPAFFVLSIAAFFAILVTGRYPRSIFEFNVGVMRWTWRVHFYSYAALGTDAYPPFTLADVPTYPARLEVDYPERLSRGLVLVKWWLLAIPHYVIIGFFAGGGLWALRYSSERGFTWGGGGLIGILVLVAGVVLLFTGRYPRSIFDFVLGMDRWVLRVGAYAALMTDEYPPFRFDAGGHDPSGPVQDSAETWQPSDHHWTGGRVASVIVGAVLVLTAMGLLTGGGTLLWADRAQRDADGFVSTSRTLTSDGYAIASENLELTGTSANANWITGTVGDIRVRVTSADPATPVFVGIAPTSAAMTYLAGTQYTTLRDWAGAVTQNPGNRTLAAPQTAGIWVLQAGGTGTQGFVAPLQNGDWTVVIANANGAPGVNVRAEVGATLPSLGTIAYSVLAVGLVLLGGGVALIVVPVRLAARRPAEISS
ncbi:DUF4389 domain-containing protein [Amycolatopsis sp. K13G38]|uniref:DUF4389 domain-containing protein n=1 Tax=Amycolatopsis acididurans TaxID=2724524 RepID=A0ABX1J068_9PSEU|nr:DUF4389 domain-containing protein [Amycolatopsis acididurans]NKQ51682.1 DUF4389 domain-containing protein [Amycolatopsis acididurans]